MIWIPFIGPVPVDVLERPAGGWSVPDSLYEFVSFLFWWEV